jgi:hypothetical protein
MGTPTQLTQGVIGVRDDGSTPNVLPGLGASKDAPGEEYGLHGQLLVLLTSRFSAPAHTEGVA